MKFPICKDSRDCFARLESGKCKALTDSYEDGECPFCKKEQRNVVTDGRERALAETDHKIVAREGGI